MGNQENIHWTDDPELLARYALGHIEASKRQDLDDHLALCDACRTAVIQETELAAGIRSVGRQHLRERLRDRLKIAEPNFLRRYQLASLAAAVIVVSIGVGFFRFYFGSFEWPSKFSSHKYILKQSSPDSSNSAQETSPPAKPEDDIAEARRTVPEPERGDHTRLSGDLASQNASGAGGKSEVGIRDLEKAESVVRPMQQSRAIWLLGTITVVRDVRGKTAMTQSLSRSQSEISAKEKSDDKQYAGGTRTLTIRKDALLQVVTLSERPVSSLPVAQQGKYNIERSVQTLIEQTQNGLAITMYRDVPALTSQIHSATIEPVTDDSLIVTMGNERIAYRIPGGWAPSSKTDNVRR